MTPPSRPASDGRPGEITDLLLAWRAGDQDARDALVRALYPRLQRLAASALKGERETVSIEVGELVHEAYLKLVRGPLPSWSDRAHFLGIAARLMRQVLVDRARSRGTEKRGGAAPVVSLDTARLIGEEGERDLLDLDRALDELQEVDESAAQVVELRFYGGMSIEETAQCLDLGLSTVKRRWRFARAWLRHSLEVGPECGA